jgi:cytochrome c oxidase subunit 2
MSDRIRRLTHRLTHRLAHRLARRLARRPTRRLAGLAGLAAAASVLLLGGVAYAGPKRETSIGLPHDASADGHRIDWLINVTSLFVGVLFVIMCIWMLWACLKHGKEHTAEYDHGSASHHVKVALTISAVIFLIVDGNLFVNAMMDIDQAFWNFKDPEANPEAVRIEINAHQWAWDARYAGQDSAFGTRDDIVTLNDIRVPVGAPVLLQLRSVDVIHSFYLPNFRVKQDATPGLTNHLWFQAKETGEFEIGCAQHCGVNHYLMKGNLTILPMADFQVWAKEESREAGRKYDEATRNEPTETFFDSQWGWAWEPNT